MNCRFMLFVVVSVMLTCSVFAQIQQWPMANADKGRSSWASMEDELYPPLQRTDSYRLKRSNGIIDNITLYDDVLCVSTLDYPNTIEAFNLQTGDTLWTFQIPETGGGCGHAVAQNDSLVFLGGQGGLGLYAFYKLTGQQKWFQPYGSLYGRNVILDETRAYFVTDSLYCIQITDGEPVWSFIFSHGTTPAVDDNNVYVCGHNRAYAFNKFDGQLIWEQYNEGLHYVAYTTDNLYLYTNTNDSVVARNKENGSIQWFFPVPDVQLSELGLNAMAVSDSILCFVGQENNGGNGFLYALDKHTGTELWRTTFEGEGVYTPIIANGVVYVTTYYNEVLYGFDVRTGQQNFQNIEWGYYSQPIVYNHQLYVCSGDRVSVFENYDTHAESFQVSRPVSFEFYQNYPNPFNPSTVICFEIPEKALVTVKIYNLLGKEISTLVDDVREAGVYQVQWNAQDFANGIYICQLNTGLYTKTRKLILQK